MKFVPVVDGRAEVELKWEAELGEGGGGERRWEFVRRQREHERRREWYPGLAIHSSFVLHPPRHLIPRLTSTFSRLPVLSSPPLSFMVVRLPSPLSFISTSSLVHPRPIHVQFRHHPHHLVPFPPLLLLFACRLPPISRSSPLVLLSADYVSMGALCAPAHSPCSRSQLHPDLPRGGKMYSRCIFSSPPTLVTASVGVVVDDGDHGHAPMTDKLLRPPLV
ncbi:hypothetical protein B0H10DRAFT_248007 [Mycena sp. CBHHK59/15]|nr:hypothetical protein B0H10DRAFT_248007 [Mycena sp. CBHHK59/15]